MDLNYNLSKTDLQSLFDWEPDLKRFRREVLEAEVRGTRDDYALVEMECSIDLIDAELLAARPAGNQPTTRLREIRGGLASLIARMNRLPAAPGGQHWAQERCWHDRAD
jgi:hypothetical protein